MRKFIYPYKKGSKSAKELSLALGSKLIKREGSKFKPNGKTIVNWGCSVLPANITNSNAIILNHPDKVALASNKLKCFNILAMTDVGIPEFGTTLAWSEDKIRHERKVFCRTKLSGNSGDGIVVAENGAQLVPAPLYTLWYLIKNEYRVHVFQGKVIDVQRKARKLDVPDEDVNWKVRNLAGGFIFSREGCEPENGVEDAAVKAVEALGLDFGAVDVMYTKSDKVMVLEVNTACGLMGSTIDSYKEAFNAI